MNSAVVRAERAKEVRDTAHGWTKAGVIASDVRAKIEALYPDDRRRLRLGLAVLAGSAVFLGSFALVGAVLFMLRLEQTGSGVVLLVCATVYAFATDYQLGPLRRADSGAELATAWMAAILFCVGLVVLANDLNAGWILAVAALVCGLGVYRWGFASLAAAGTLFALLALARLPQGRWWWIGGCLIALAVTGSRALLARLAPSHRGCLRVVFGMALLGLYFAIHYDTFKEASLEWLGDEPRTWGPALLTVSAVLTALVPIAILVFGIRRRDRIAITIGALLVGVSLSTWRYHHPWIPLWLSLSFGGGVCFVTAILVRRFLDRAPEREWRGITADPLFDDPAHAAALRIAAVAATLGHAPRAGSGDRPFQAGGGESGGGGADGRL